MPEGESRARVVILTGTYRIKGEIELVAPRRQGEPLTDRGAVRMTVGLEERAPPEDRRVPDAVGRRVEDVQHQVLHVDRGLERRWRGRR